MSVNLKGKTYRNTQEQVLENAKNIEKLEGKTQDLLLRVLNLEDKTQDLLLRVIAIEEALPSALKELYLHTIQVRDAQLVD